MDILTKIVITVAFFGLLGGVYNMIKAKDPGDIKNHIYSTFLAIPIFIYAIGLVALKVWKMWF